MKKLLLLITCLYASSIFAQDSLYQLDVLRAPSSPAANLVGTAPSEVQSFTDPTAFMVSLQNATNNFSSLPKSYAIDIAPAWLFNAKNISYRSYSSASPGKSIPQSLVISTAINSVDDDSMGKYTDVGVSVKFSIFRGKWGNAHLQSLDSLHNLLGNYANLRNEVFGKYQDQLNAITNQMKDASNERKAQLAAQYSQLTVKRQAELDQIATDSPAVKTLADSIKNVASRVSLKRYGFKTDVVLGTAFDFPNQLYEKGYMAKTGVWATAGWDDESGLSITTLYRYLYNPDKVFADDKNVLHEKDVSTLDIGGKLQYENLDYKITIGAEAIYRSVINYNNVPSTWRYTINADYAFQKNMHLTLALGRNYDGVYSNDGTVIAMLNLLFGLGNGKKLN